MNPTRRLLAIVVGLWLVVGASQASAGPYPWVVQKSPNPHPPDFLLGVSTTSPANAWAVGCSKSDCPFGNARALIEHYDGTMWKKVHFNLPGTSSELFGVRATSSTNAWAVGSWKDVERRALVEHWDGTTWARQIAVSFTNRDNRLLGVAAASASNAWAVGASPGIGDPDQGNEIAIAEHYDGTSWTMQRPKLPGDSAVLKGIATPTANDAWAVGTFDDGTGNQALIEHWDGTAWHRSSTTAFGSPVRLRSVSAVSASNIWAVGDHNGTALILHFDGTGWSKVSSPSADTYELEAVKAVSANDVWAVGWRYQTIVTLILHYNGSSWSIVDSPNEDVGTNFLEGVGGSAGNLFAVGHYYNYALDDPATLVEHCC